MRARAVADGQQVDIPVLQYDRTVGTRKESGSREWKARYKRGRSASGKSGVQSEDVMWGVKPEVCELAAKKSRYCL